MRFNFKIFSALTAIIVVFNSCKNELNILAPYKETISVYALLNPQETLQYVRINKVFLGEGNSYEMAQVSDSVNYKEGVLSVSLERYTNGIADLTTVGNPTKKKIILTDTVVQTQSGTFNSTQRLFITHDKLFTNGEYRLSIVNNLSGNTFSAKATIIDSIKPTLGYSPLDAYYYPRPIGSPLYQYLDYAIPTAQRNIRFFSVPNAREYQVIMRFHYRDFLQTGDSVAKFMNFNFSSITSQDLTGGELLSVSFYMSAFYSQLVSQLTANQPANLLYRRAVKMDFLVTAVGQDFSDFLKVSAPSTSVAQDKPVYTNIEGGYGVFSCRSRYHISKHMSNNLIDYMANTKPICDLRFVNSAGVLSALCN